MRLRQLTLCGFKSFPDRTQFTFDEPLIVIVGPNGCGKSNLVDAIRWVLGERSSKSLRGDEMADVIFAGSAGRKPAGLASVTLTFDNPVIDPEAPMADPPGLVEDSAPSSSRPARTGLETSDVPKAHSGADSGTSAPRRRRALPIEADIVEVERQLYRDGTSRFFINGKPVRLRDIRDLFLDTGIGHDGYSIIEQGKVDAMLLASPLERRAIFEEAAGIARYRQRRGEAQRKLERTQANLTLVRQQQEEAARRLRAVRAQAARARKYRELETQWRALRMALAFEQYDDICRRLEGLTSRQADLESQRHQAIAAVESLESAHQEGEVARHEANTQVHELERQQAEASHALAAARHQQAFARQALDEQARRRDEDASRLAALAARVQELHNAWTAATARASAARASARELEQQQADAWHKRQNLLWSRDQAERELAQHRQTLADLEHQRVQAHVELESTRRQQAALTEELKRLSVRIESLNAERSAAAAAMGDIQANLEGLTRDLGEAECELEQARAQAAAARLAQAEQARAAARVAEAKARAESRRTTLEEVVGSRLDLGDTVRAVLEARQNGTGFGSVLGVLADFLETDPDHAPLIEAALGPTLQALVVRSLDDLPPAETLATLPGRAMFIPLAIPADCAPRTSSTCEDPDFAPAVAPSADSAALVPLRSVVRAAQSRLSPSDAAACVPALPNREALEALLDRLLGHTYLVPSVESARRHRPRCPEARHVSRDGTVLEPDGRVLGGPLHTAPETGVLQRRSELAQLSRTLVTLERESHDWQARLADAEANARSADASVDQARCRCAELHHRLGEQRAAAERLSSDLARLERDLTDARTQRQHLADCLASMEQQQAGLRQHLEHLDSLIQAQHAQIAHAARTLETIAADLAAADEAWTALRVESTRAAEQALAAERDAERLLASLREAEHEREAVAESTSREQARQQELHRAIEQAAAAEAQAQAAAEQARQRLEQARQQVAYWTQAVETLAQQRAVARSRAQQLDRDWHALEVTRRELEVRRESLEERTREELALDLPAEYPQYRELMADGSVARLDPAEAAVQADALRDDLRRLGHVNLEALEEEGQLSRQHEALTQQLADIEQAARDLHDLIDRLDRLSRARFEETFARIQAHFAGPDGMFRKLFGGGRAEIRLIPLDRSSTESAAGSEADTPSQARSPCDRAPSTPDILDAGIEIIARPPGKQPRTINQLSGGEKTLTALALLLAVFRSRPGCFCILDEVDASLDEANVARFCAVLREFTARSHFIVITHNRKTMQAADRLYGVTMQERGVSTRVSVRLEQVGDDGTIHALETTSPSPEPRLDGEPPRPIVRSRVRPSRREARDPVASRLADPAAHRS